MTTRKLPLILLLMMVIVSTVSFLPVQEARASVELAYDDGSWDTVAGGPNDFLTVRFSLPSGMSSAKLLTARIYRHDVDPSSTIVEIHVWGSTPGTDLITPFNYDLAVDNAFNDVDLSGYNVLVSGDFYIAIKYLTQYNPSIGLDTNAPIDLRSYYGYPAFLTSMTSGDLMIRAVIEVPPAPVGGVVMPTNTLAILAPFAALAGLVAVVSAVVVVKKRRD